MRCWLKFLQLLSLSVSWLVPSALTDVRLEERRRLVSDYREKEDLSPHSCSFERLNAARLTPRRFQQVIADRRKPLLIYNLETWQKLNSHVNEEGLLGAYGDQLVPLEACVDPGHSSFKFPTHTHVLRDYVLGGNPSGSPEVVLDTGLNCNFSRQVWRDKEASLPRFLKEFSAMPVVSVGTIATGLGMHQHNESWLLSLHGRKAWWIGEESARENRYFGISSPCQHLGAELPSRYQFCVQQPGELVYFPSGSWHATCNIDDLVFSIGSQSQVASWPELMKAVVRGDLKAVEHELTGASGDYEDTIFVAAFDRALALDRKEIIQRLLEHVKDHHHLHVMAAPLERRMPGSLLQATARAGSEGLSLQLIASGFSPLEPFNREVNKTAFESAAEYGHVSLLHIFAEAEASQRSSGKVRSDRAATLAAQSGHLQILQELKAFNFNLRAPGEHNRWPLHGAAAGGHVPVAKALTGKKLLHLEAADAEGHVPMHAAAEHGHAEMLTFLFNHGARVDVRNADGWQPLHVAASHGHLPAVACLLKQRADTASKGHSATPIHLAAAAGAPSVVELLLERGVNINATKNEAGRTLLQVAALSGSRFVSELLIKRRADAHAATRGGHRALHLAAGAGHAALTEFLLAQTLQADEREQLAGEVFRVAAVEGQVEVIDRLVASGWGKQLFTEDASGVTATSLASKHGHKAALDFITAVATSSRSRVSEL